MKRLQIMIEEDLDKALERRANEEGVPKADLIRRFLRMAIEPLPPLRQDPLWKLVGADSFEPSDIDDTVDR